VAPPEADRQNTTGMTAALYWEFQSLILSLFFTSKSIFRKGFESYTTDSFPVLEGS